MDEDVLEHYLAGTRAFSLDEHGHAVEPEPRGPAGGDPWRSLTLTDGQTELQNRGYNRFAAARLDGRG
jgi:hypothetical protein